MKTSLSYPVRQVIPTSIAHRFGLFSAVVAWMRDSACALIVPRHCACSGVPEQRVARVYRRRMPVSRMTVIKTRPVRWKPIFLSGAIVVFLITAGVCAGIYLEQAMH